MNKITIIVEAAVFAFVWTEMQKAMFLSVTLDKKLIRRFQMFLVTICSCYLVSIGKRYFLPLVNVCLSGGINWVASKRTNRKSMLEAIFSYIIVKLFWGCSLILTFFIFAFIDPINQYPITGMFASAILISVYSICIRHIDSVNWNVVTSIYQGWIIVAFGALFMVSYAALVIRQMEQRREFGIYTISVLFLLSVILFVWTKSRIEQQKIEANQSEHIEKLIRDVHQYKEVIPAAKRELYLAQKKMLAEHRWGVAAEIGGAIEELDCLGDTISAWSMKELAETMNFDTTGLRLLDSQLQNEQEMAAEEGINFSCVVTSPAAFLVKTGVIQQFHLQQMVGDLVRNAIRAVRLVEGRDKRILLVMGERPEGYQIRICDTGLPFPPEILRDFGRRGLTTGGSGHGLADLREIMAGCAGSITVTEYGEESSYSKAISLVMDGRGMLRVHSALSGVDYERPLLEPAGSRVK